VDGAEIGVFKETDDVGLSDLLKSTDGRCLESYIVLELGSNFTHEALERKLAMAMVSSRSSHGIEVDVADRMSKSVVLW
jgi:hypothetical protein